MSKNFILKTFFALAGFLVLPASVFALTLNPVVVLPDEDVAITAGDDTYLVICYPTTSPCDIDTNDCAGVYSGPTTFFAECGEPPFDIGTYTVQELSVPEYNLIDQKTFQIALASAGFLTLPVNSIASTTAYIGSLIDSIASFLWLIIGLPLGFLVVQKWLKLMP